MRFFVVIFLLLISCAGLSAAEGSLYLIPTPKKTDRLKGYFNFAKPYAIHISNADSFIVNQLQEAIEKKFNKYPAKAVGAHKINLLQVDSFNYVRFIKSEKIKSPFALGNEGYLLLIKPKGITIIANQSAGVFYGVQTLLQLINANAKNGSVPCLIIYDKPDMAMRGWQDDISRGPIPTMDFLKEEIRRMASYKLNTFTLYTEHVFKLKKH
ncbi:MAG TPA: glycoside hydrolase family 20 zincin-like fold domain-containing protein, partial [Chitinophagales bacterium]|nr:glycoside hydrolase family 20 zincin-like fold domain-containing protein [Chitinophagales bacterium]